jgi:hypothetical protein
MKIYDGAAWVAAGGTSSGGSGDVTNLVATATLSSWGTIASGSCVRKNISLPGTVSADVIGEGWPAAIPDNLSLKMRSAVDAVVVEICNWTGTGIAVSDGMTFKAMVLRSTI